MRVSINISPTLILHFLSTTMSRAFSLLTQLLAHRSGRTEIGSNMGFFARFTDTEGNLLGIYSQS